MVTISQIGIAVNVRQLFQQQLLREFFGITAGAEFEIIWDRRVPACALLKDFIACHLDVSKHGQCANGFTKCIKVCAHGGENFYDGWMKNPKSAMISCNDGFRPVSFLIETIDED